MQIDVYINKSITSVWPVWLRGLAKQVGPSRTGGQEGKIVGKLGPRGKDQSCCPQAEFLLLPWENSGMIMAFQWNQTSPTR